MKELPEFENVEVTAPMKEDLKTHGPDHVLLQIREGEGSSVTVRSVAEAAMIPDSRVLLSYEDL